MSKTLFLALVILITMTWIGFSLLVKFESNRMEERAINSAVELCTEVCKVR